MTNTLPIRRLGLEVGETAPVRSAWLGLTRAAARYVRDELYPSTGLTHPSYLLRRGGSGAPSA